MTTRTASLFSFLTLRLPLRFPSVKQLPSLIDSSASLRKSSGRVSQSYPWYVAAALLKSPNLSAESSYLPIVKLTQSLRRLESDTVVQKDNGECGETDIADASDRYGTLIFRIMS